MEDTRNEFRSYISSSEDPRQYVRHVFVRYQGIMAVRSNRFECICYRVWPLDRELSGTGWRMVVLVHFIGIVAIAVQLRIGTRAMMNNFRWISQCDSSCGETWNVQLVCLS